MSTPSSGPVPDDAAADRTSSRDLTLLLVLMCVALALVVGSISGLTLALPSIAADIGATQLELSYVVNFYALVFAGLLLPLGFAADKFSRKGFLLAGLVVFGAANLVGAFVDDPTTLIALRGVAGVGAATIMPATLSVLVDTFPPERRAFAISVWAGVSGGGAMLGLLLAGGLLEVFSWGSFLVVSGVIALAVAAAAVRIVPDSRQPSLSLDPLGGLLAFVGLTGLVLGIMEGPERGWTAPLTLTALIVGAVVTVAFVVVEARQSDPMLDVRLFRRRGLQAGAAVVFLQFVAAYVLFFLLPQFLQFVDGNSPLGAALRLLPMALGIAPASQFGPQLLARFGARNVATAGMSIMALAYLAIALTTGGAYWPTALALVVFGLGFGLSVTPGTQLIIEGLPADRRTLSAAVNDVTREVGGALGGALAASVLLGVYGARLSTEGLPPEVAETAEEGAGAALGIAEQLGPQGAALAQSAQDAFASGYEVGHFVGAGILALGALLAFLLAPKGVGQGEVAGVEGLWSEPDPVEDDLTVGGRAIVKTCGRRGHATCCSFPDSSA
jgi:EmrB/QacA subfamily drug resistance transporter